jgi:hypothetical protein
MYSPTYNIISILTARVFTDLAWAIRASVVAVRGDGRSIVGKGGSREDGQESERGEEMHLCGRKGKIWSGGNCKFRDSTLSP